MRTTPQSSRRYAAGSFETPPTANGQPPRVWPVLQYFVSIADGIHLSSTGLTDLQPCPLTQVLTGRKQLSDQHKRRLTSADKICINSTSMTPSHIQPVASASPQVTAGFVTGGQDQALRRANLPRAEPRSSDRDAGSGKTQLAAAIAARCEAPSRVDSCGLTKANV